MVGIVLTVFAVLLVIVLAFCHSEQNRGSRGAPKELPFFDRTHKKRS
jgi:hypothetical protein